MSVKQIANLFMMNRFKINNEKYKTEAIQV